METTELIYNILGNSLLMFITGITVWSSLKIWKRIFFIFFSIVFISVNAFSYYSSMTATIRVENSAKKSQDSLHKINDSLTRVIITKADSLHDIELSTKDTIKAAIDSSYAHSIIASNKALAGFGIQLQDSLRLLQFHNNDLMLGLAPVSTHSIIFEDSLNNQRIINIQLKAYGGSIFNLHLKYFILTRSKFLALSPIIDLGIINTQSMVGTDNIRTIFFTPNKIAEQKSNAIVVIKGTYSKLNDSNATIQPFRLCFFYDFLSKKVNGYLELDGKIFPQTE